MVLLILKGYVAIINNTAVVQLLLFMESLFFQYNLTAQKSRI